jgi:hypothetical protein
MIPSQPRQNITCETPSQRKMLGVVVHACHSCYWNRRIVADKFKQKARLYLKNNHSKKG